jgi:hypothetical protein
VSRLLPFIIATFALSCAQGSAQPDSDAGTNGDPAADAGVSDTDTTDSGSSETNNSGMEMGDPCGECCPGDRICMDDTNLGVCREDGSGFDAMPCNEDTVCEDGTCVTAPACMAGALDCLDSTTVLRCRQSGEGWIQMTCESGLLCSQGECTDKVTLGGGCSADDDCATGNCRCDADDGCPDVGGGICTDTECEANSCGMNAHCLDSARAPISAEDYDHCVLDCSSEDVTCPSGSKCMSIPAKTSDGWEWRKGCYFQNVNSFGGDCTGAADCIAGDCLVDYFDTGFCSRTCEDADDCPADSACVELQPGENWCALLCGDGSVAGTDSCPLDEPDERFDVTCKTKVATNDNVYRVCATP